jgi:hypothetical protein
MSAPLMLQKTKREYAGRGAVQQVQTLTQSGMLKPRESHGTYVRHLGIIRVRRLIARLSSPIFGIPSDIRDFHLKKTATSFYPAAVLFFGRANRGAGQTERVPNRMREHPQI